jgi:DNA mismatch repair protein MutL
VPASGGTSDVAGAASAFPSRAVAGEAVTGVRAAVENYLTAHDLWPADAGRGVAVEAAAAAATAAGATEGITAVLGQLDDTYIIVRRGRDLIVVDQHTAHERVIYERLAAAERLGRQVLLMPVVVTMSPAAAADLRACLPELDAVGYDVDEFGAAAFVVRSHPADLAPRDFDAFLDQVVRDFAAAGRPAGADARRESVLKSAACRGAVMAGETLAPEEMAALVRDLFGTAKPDVCPHGRPTMVNLPARELEKWFKR